MKKLKTIIFTACALFSLGATASTEHTTVQGDHGKLDVVIQRPDNNAGNGSQANAKAKAGKKTPLLVLCHGFGGNKEGKFEDMTVLNEIEDAKCILRYASSQPWVSKIAMGGHSQGGVVTAMTSGQLVAQADKDIKKIQAVVLLAPAAVLRDDALRGNTFGKMYDPKNPPAKIEMWGGNALGGNYIRTATTLPIYETAKNYHGAECILHGDADRVVPYTYGQRFHYLNKKSEWHLMTDADHGFGGQEEQAAHIASDFLAKVLK